jgi:hypothetical protein
MCRSSIRLRMSRGTSSERAVPMMRRRLRCGPGSDPISPQSGRIAAVSARPDADPSLAASKKPYRNRARPKQHRKLLRPACWAGYFRGSQRPLDCGLAERYGRACSYPERRMRDREEANLDSTENLALVSTLELPVRARRWHVKQWDRKRVSHAQGTSTAAPSKRPARRSARAWLAFLSG